MQGKQELQRGLQNLLKQLQSFNDEAEQWLSSHNPKRESQRKLKEVKQGSMNVEEYFHEVELAKIRAAVKENEKATKDPFINGLNPKLAHFANNVSFMDIDLLVSFVAEYEQKIKKQRHSKRSSNAEENEGLQNVIAINDPKPSKEEKVLNDGITATKCEEEDFCIPGAILVDEENLHNDERKSENMSEIDCCEIVREKKIEFEKEVEIESIECFKNEECKRKSEKEEDVEIIECFQIQGSEKNCQKNLEKSEVERICKDLSFITNHDYNSFPCEPIALQVLLDLSPKKPPDKRSEPLSPLSGIEEHFASLKLDSRTNPFEERGNDAIRNQEVISSNSIDNSSIPRDPLLIPSVPIIRARAKRIEEALNDRGAYGVFGGVQQGTHVGIQYGIIRDNHILGGTDIEQEDVYTQGASKKAQDPHHDIMGPITRSSISDDMFERLDDIFGLSFGSLKAHNVSIYVGGANEALTTGIQARMNAFRAHVSLSTWQMMKIHEIGIT